MHPLQNLLSVHIVPTSTYVKKEKAAMDAPKGVKTDIVAVVVASSPPIIVVAAAVGAGVAVVKHHPCSTVCTMYAQPILTTHFHF